MVGLGFGILTGNPVLAVVCAALVLLIAAYLLRERSSPGPSMPRTVAKRRRGFAQTGYATTYDGTTAADSSYVGDCGGSFGGDGGGAGGC